MYCTTLKQDWIKLQPFRDIGLSEKLHQSFDSFIYTTKDSRVEDSIDMMGYFGSKRRLAERNITFSNINLSDLCFRMQNLNLITKQIKQVDKDKNGNVTVTELEDIIKLFNQDLEVFDLKKAIADFTYDHNSLLVDYKRFLNHVSKL